MGIKEKILELESKVIDPKYVILNESYKAELFAINLPEYDNIDELIDLEIEPILDTGLIVCYTQDPTIDIVIL